MIIPQIVGPECPRCGCRNSFVVKVQSWFGARVILRRCRHCATRFNAPAEPVEEPSLDIPKGGFLPESAKTVSYSSALVKCRCPKCQARNPPVKSTQTAGDSAKIRHHKCAKCGETFKSVEAIKNL